MPVVVIDDDKGIPSKRKASAADSDSDFSGANEDIGSSDSESEENVKEIDNEEANNSKSDSPENYGMEDITDGFVGSVEDGSSTGSDDEIQSEEEEEAESESEKVSDEEEDEENEVHEEEETSKDEDRIKKASHLREQFGTPATFSAIRTLFDVKFSGDVASRGKHYLLSGGSLEELITQVQFIDMKRKSNSIVIFQAIQVTLIRVMQEKLMDPAELTEICKYFVTNHIVDVLGQLAASTPIHFKKLAIKLLSALATVDDVIALQILSSVDLTRDQLKMLTHAEDPTNPAALRVLFIHFLMALIIGHSPSVIRKLASKKFWLPSIFLGLRFDLLSTVGLVLKTLDDHVIQNSAVPKTSKLFIFNSRTLCNLLDLYKWNPASFIDFANKQTVNKLKINPPEIEEVNSVRELVHGVLLHLLTSTKLGVIFHDPSYGTSILNANETVNQFLKQSGQPWEDQMKAELFSKMLSTCPDLMKSFMNLVNKQLQVQNVNTKKWLGITQFLTETVSNIKIVPDSFTTLLRATTVSTQILVPTLFFDIVANSLKENEKTATGLLLYIASLSKLKEVSEILRFRHPNIYKPYISKLADHLCASSITADKLLGALSTLYTAKSVDGIEALCDVLFFLGDFVPQTLDPVKYNSLHLKELDDVIQESKSLTEVSRIKLIKLQLLLDPQVVKKEGAFDITEICRLVASTESADIKNLGLSVIRAVLHNTGFFSEGAWELDLWMTCVRHYVQSGFGKKLASAIRYAEDHKFELSNAILRSHRLHSSTNLETLDLKLDDFLAMEESDEDNMDINHQNMSLSPLLPGFLRANGKMDNVTKAFTIHYAHMVPSEGFISLVKETLGRDHPVLDYLDSLAQGKLTPLNFSPFTGSIFEGVSDFIQHATSEDCLEEIDPNDVELVASQVIRFAVQSQNDPERLSRCVQLLSKLCEQPIDSSSSFKSENVLRYSGLLDGFHPILSGTGHVNKIVHILGQAVNDKDHPNLKPFAQRIYFELEYGIRKKSSLHDVDSNDLKTFLQLFPITKQQVSKLIKGVFIMKPKYFYNKGSCTPWVNVVEHLMSLAASMEIVLSEDELLGLMKSLTKLVPQPEIFHLPDLLHEYLSRIQTDLNGYLLDAAIDLLKVLCTSDSWYEALACDLMRRVEEQPNVLPAGTEFNREVTLLASLQRPLPGCLDHDLRAAIKALSSNQTFLTHLANIAPVAFSSETCSTMAAKVVKHSADVYPSPNALKVLDTVFSKADKLQDLLHLTQGWMETYISQDPGVCVGMSETFESIASRIEDSNLPSLSGKLMDFLISDGMTRSCESMIGVLRIFLSAGRLPVDPAALFQKLTSHTKFDSALTGANENCKCAFISLLSTLIEKDGSLINGQRLPGFLSAYGATLSQSDQLLLKILQQHEKSGVNLSSYKPLLWGDAALSHYSVHKKPSLSKSHPYQTLDALSPSLVTNTIANFPIHRDVQGVVEGDASVYDPAFILPLLCQTVLPGHKIKSRTFFQSGAVGLALASLASLSPIIRSVATLFLQRIHENHIGQDKIVWANFIDCVRRGVVELRQNNAKNKKKSKTSDDEQEVPRLCSITATFLARASTVLGDPSAPLYRPLHNFVLARPSLKLYGVPAFLELLHSNDVKNHERHREWILEVIRDGMREHRDLQMVLNSFTLKIIMVFYSTSLVKSQAKRLIEQIVGKCLKEADKEGLLMTNYSILPWILGSRKPPSLTSALPKLSPFSQHASLLSLATG